MSDSVIFVVRFLVQENKPEELPGDRPVKYDKVLARSIHDWIPGLGRHL